MHLLLSLILTFHSIYLWAHQSTLTSDGRAVGWSTTNLPIYISVNTTDMSSADASTIILAAMNQWNQAAGINIYSTSSSINKVQFTSNFNTYGSAVIGVTEISYNSAGAIQKASILLNDNYNFMSTPGNYSGNSVYLGDVVTHEFGHFLGLGHSEVLDASMFYAAFPGQATLSLDDKAGARTKYSGGTGLIYGHMKGGNKIPINGVHVQAISRNTGEAVGAMSDASGYFQISGLSLDDTYYLYTSPLKNLSALSSGLSNVQNTFCPGVYIGSFFSACGKEDEGFPQGINLSSSNPFVSVGTVTINCSLKANEDYGYQKISSTYNAVTEVSTFGPVSVAEFDNSDPKHEQAFTGYFFTNLSGTSAPDVFEVDLTDFTDLSGSTKYLKVNIVSQALGTPLGYNLRVKQNGSYVTSAERSIDYSLTTQTYKTELESFVTLSTTANQNDFILEVRAKKLSDLVLEDTIPSFATFVSETSWPYLLMVSISETTAAGIVPIMDAQQAVSDNSNCLDAPFSFNVPKAKSIQETNSEGKQEGLNAASCGTTGSSGGNNGHSGPVLLALGFLIALASVRISKKAKNFLS